MMKARLGLAMVGLVAVYGCGLFGKRSADVSGTDTIVPSMTRVTGTDDADEMFPDLNPMGTQMAYARRAKERRANFDLWVMDTQSQRAPQRITDFEADDLRPVWSETGQSLVFDTKIATSRTICEKAVGTSGPVQMLTSDEKLQGKTQDSDAAVSAQGKLAYVACPDTGSYSVQKTLKSLYPKQTTIVIADASGKVITKQKGLNPRWSPDGSKIAFASDMTKTFGQRFLRVRNRDIWVMNADGSGLRQLTWHSADDIEPAWSPDGDQIVFASNRSRSAYDADNYDLWIMNSDGTGLSQLTKGKAHDGHPVWATTGFIYFHSDRGGQWDIWRVKPVSSDSEVLAIAGFTPIRGTKPIGSDAPAPGADTSGLYWAKAPVAGVVWGVANIPSLLVATGAVVFDALTLFRSSIYGPNPVTLADGLYVPFSDVYAGLWE